jgi:hypothetical protein
LFGPAPDESARPGPAFGFDSAVIATHRPATAAPPGRAGACGGGRISGILLFLDVDGTLLPFAPRVRSAPAGDNPLLARLDPADGSRLRALGCSLVWATTWGQDANTVLSPRLGLPELPVLDWPDDDEDPPTGVHWKTPALVRWAAGRPFAWLDDEIFDADRRWIAEHHPAPVLAHRVDPRSGLTGADFDVVRSWLRRLG